MWPIRMKSAPQSFGANLYHWAVLLGLQNKIKTSK
uniref:Uncharacterized protein n=1 Tax=Anguilla anguilla TaxID=7936 RepID=A0A0E9R7E4_ANGAN